MRAITKIAACLLGILSSAQMKQPDAAPQGIMASVTVLKWLALPATPGQMTFNGQVLSWKDSLEPPVLAAHLLVKFSASVLTVDPKIEITEVKDDRGTDFTQTASAMLGQATNLPSQTSLNK